MGQFKDMFENTKGAVTDNFGNTVVPGELVGFHKTIAGNKLFIYGKYDYLEKLSPNEDEHKVSVVYFPYGEGVSSSKIKEKILENYKVLQDKANNHLPAEIEIKK